MDSNDRTERIRERAYHISLLRTISAPEADWFEAEREIEEEERRSAGERKSVSQFIPNEADSKG
jgi:hypothetical protein